MDQIPKPPYSNSDIEFFARRQLGQHKVPEGYIKQLQKHLKYFGHDHLFRLTPYGGDGFGVIDCLEPGCGAKNIILQPRTTIPDGGRSTGVGGLAAFQTHIIDDGNNHEDLRDRRLRKAQKETKATPRQASGATPHGSVSSTTKAPVTSNAPPMTQARRMAEPPLSTRARVASKDPATTQAEVRAIAKDPTTTQAPTRGVTTALLPTQARVPAKDPATTQAEVRAIPKDPTTTQAPSRGMTKALLPTQARVPAKDPITSQAKARGVTGPLPTHTRVSAKNPVMAQAQATAKASTSGFSSGSTVSQSRTSRQPAPPTKISQVYGSSMTPSKRPTPTLSKDSSVEAKRRKISSEVIPSSKPKGPVPSKGVSTLSMAPQSIAGAPRKANASVPSQDIIDMDSEPAPEDWVWLDGEGLVPCSQLWPKEPSIPQATSSSAAGVESVRNAPSLPQSSSLAYPSTSRPMSHFDAPASRAHHNPQYSVPTPGTPSQVVPAPQTGQPPGWHTSPYLASGAHLHQITTAHPPYWKAYNAPPHVTTPAHPPYWKACNPPPHVAQPMASHKDQRSAPLNSPAMPFFGHQFGSHPAPQVTNPLAAPRNQHAAKLPSSSSMLNLPSTSTSTTTTPLVLNRLLSKVGSRKTPVRNPRKSVPPSTPRSALSRRSVKTCSTDMTPKSLYSWDLPDLPIMPLKLPRKKGAPVFNPLDPLAGPAPIMTETERQEFFKAAADNSSFEHNTTIETARMDLGITGTDPHIDGLAVILLPHQLLGVSWMLKQEKERNNGGIMADEMGMGKTVQMIATMVKNSSTDPKIKSNLIVAPLALLEQWREEIMARSTRDLKILLYHTSHSKPTSKKEIAKYDIVITTLQTLSREWYDDEGAARKLLAEGSEDDESTPWKKRMGPLFKIEWYRVVIDEAQIIRNPRSLVSRAVCDLRATYRWCLTGTPIFNTLWDIFPLLRFLRIRPYNDRAEFSAHIGRNEKKNPDLAATRAQAALLTCMLRRQKHSKLDGKLLLNLPPKSTEDRMLEMSTEEREVYDMVEKQMQDKFNKFLKRGTVLKNYANVFVMLLRLRQACGHPSLVTQESGDPFEEDPTVDRLALRDVSSELARAQSKMGQEWIDKVKKKLQDEADELVEAEKNDPTSASAPECPICGDPLEDSARITKCTHVFCEGCIDQVIDHVDPANVADEQSANPDMVKRPCPSCRAPFSRIDTFLRKAFLPHVEDDDDEDDDLPDLSCLEGRKRRNGVLDDSDAESPSSPSQKGKGKAVDPPMPAFPPSTKMLWLLEELERAKAENPGDKTIVISQWTSMLDLVAVFLSRHGYRHVLYRGDMSISQRNQTVVTFLKDQQIPIMLMSLKCGGVGLNLTVANRVISLDLAWSPATEAQAFDRVHRVGQTKDVFIRRVIINGTVEQRICELQRNKQNLTDSALGEGGGKKLKRLTVAQLTRLFNLDSYGNRMN